MKQPRRSLVGHPSVQRQTAGSGTHAVGDLDIADVERVFSLNPQCGEDRGGAIYLKFVLGVVKYLDPRPSRESHWMRDMIIEVGKWPLWSKRPGEDRLLSFWNGLIEDETWLVLCEHLFDQVIYRSHAVGWVYYLHSFSLNGGSSCKELSLLSDGYTTCTVIF